MAAVSGSFVNRVFGGSLTPMLAADLFRLSARNIATTRATIVSSPMVVPFSTKPQARISFSKSASLSFSTETDSVLRDRHFCFPFDLTRP